MIRLFVTLLTCAFVLMLSAPTSAQQYFSRDASIAFDATAAGSPETIEAKHNSGTVIIDQATGAVQAQVLIRGFLFERALMQEHFNENYMESGKYPKATFKGNLAKQDAALLAKDGSYSLSVKGKMTVHGVTKDMSTTVKFVVKNGLISTSTSFEIPFSDYGIDIPSVVSDKVAKAAKVEVSATLAPLRK